MEMLNHCEERISQVPEGWHHTNQPTDFRVGLGIEKHSTCIGSTIGRTCKQVSPKRVARFNSLHGEISAHGIRYLVAILSAFDALLCNVLDLCPPAQSKTTWSAKNVTGMYTNTVGSNVPVLEPDLNGAFSHVDFLGNSLAHTGGRCWVLVEFHLERQQLVLRRPLALLILLLLGKGALSRRPPGHSCCVTSSPRASATEWRSCSRPCWAWERQRSWLVS